MRRFAIFAPLVFLAACAGVPANMGSPTLNAAPSPLLAADPYAEIAAGLLASPLWRVCGETPRREGPAANLEASLIPSTDDMREGRRTQALTSAYNFGLTLTGGRWKGAHLDVLVPQGFVTDFFSAPSAADQLTAGVGLALEAAVIHDWLYAIGQPGDASQRDLADQALIDILRLYNVPGGSRWVVGLGVRQGGKSAFGRPEELRFYNKCFYGHCPAGRGSDARTGARPAPLPANFGASPAAAPPDDPALRARLWDLTVCVNPDMNQPGPAIAAVGGR